MDKLKYIIKFLISLVSEPAQTWDYLSTGDQPEAKPDYMQRNYYLPLLGIMSVVLFVCGAMYGQDGDATFDVERGMQLMVPCLVAYFVAPYVAVEVLWLINGHYYKVPDASKERLTIFVFYCMSFLIAVEMLTAILPWVRFFGFITIYLLFITWNGVTTYVRIDEGNRWFYAFLSAVVIGASEYGFKQLLVLMQG